MRDLNFYIPQKHVSLSTFSLLFSIFFPLFRTFMTFNIKKDNLQKQTKKENKTYHISLTKKLLNKSLFATQCLQIQLPKRMKIANQNSNFHGKFVV